MKKKYRVFGDLQRFLNVDFIELEEIIERPEKTNLPWNSIKHVKKTDGIKDEYCPHCGGTGNVEISQVGCAPCPECQEEQSLEDKFFQAGVACYCFDPVQIAKEHYLGVFDKAIKGMDCEQYQPELSELRKAIEEG